MTDTIEAELARLREECDRDHMPPAVAARLRAERDEAVAEMERLRGLLDEASEDIRSLSGDTFRLAAALRKIADYGRGRGMDGCHEEKLRDIARAALAPKEPTDD